MTFLPIVQRELRVRARSRANYWGRFTMGVVAVLVCVPPLVWSGPFSTAAMTGRAAFEGLVSAAFLLCCAACLLTADTISAERRQGTLELLLLTRARHFDVLLGKFASNSLACFLGLLAFLPVLALPLLTGGVTGGETARKAVALLDTLFLALSAGLWASANGFERFRTARLALVAMAVLVLVPSLIGWILPGTKAGLASPLGVLAQAADLAYKASKARYWLSLGLLQAFAWLLMFAALACLRTRLRRDDGSLTGTPARSGSASAETGVVTATAPGSASIKCRYCGRQNCGEAVYCQECGTALHPTERRRTRPANLASAPTPLHWLLQRQRGLKAILWGAALLNFFHLALFGLLGRLFPFSTVTMFYGVPWALSLAATAISSSLFAWVASRFFVEARRTGELELLLTTPLGAEQIVSAQWDVLKRLVRWPVLLMLAPLVVQGVLILSLGYGGSLSNWRFYYAQSLVLSGVNAVLSVAALCWLGLWFGLRVAVPGRVILWAVLLTNGLPYVLGWACSLVQSALLAGWTTGPVNSWFTWPWVLGSLVPQVVPLLFYLWLIRLARWHLLHELAGADPFAPSQIFSGALRRSAFIFRRARQWPNPR